MHSGYYYARCSRCHTFAPVSGDVRNGDIPENWTSLFAMPAKINVGGRSLGIFCKACAMAVEAAVQVHIKVEAPKPEGGG